MDSEYLLLHKVMHDIAERVKVVMRSQNISIPDTTDDSKIILAYMNAMGKRILPRPRKVHFSSELREKISNHSFFKDGFCVTENEAMEIIDLITHFQGLIESGSDINNHLSIQIFSSKRQDILFNTWNIKHIHLNKQEAKSKKAMKRNRADFLLFCVVEHENVYFIDVRQHPEGNEFSSHSFLEIAFNNGWMERLGFVEIGSEYVPYSIEPKVTDDKIIYELYKDNLNIAFDFQGHGFIGIASGITSSGDRSNNVYYLHQLKRKIIQIPYDLNEYCGFSPISPDRVSGTIEFNRGGSLQKYQLFLD